MKNKKILETKLNYLTIILVLIFIGGLSNNYAQNKEKPPVEHLVNKNIVVLDFVNFTGNADYNYLSQTIPDAINAKLTQSNTFNIHPRSKVPIYIEKLKIEYNQINQDTNMLKVGEMIDADVVISGSFKVHDGIITIDIKAIEVISGRLTTQLRFEGKLDENIFDLIDNISNQANEVLVKDFKPEPPRYKIIKENVTSDIRNPKFLVKEAEPTYGGNIDFSIIGISLLDKMQQSYNDGIYPSDVDFNKKMSPFIKIPGVNFGFSMQLYWNFVMTQIEYRRQSASNFLNKFDFKDGTELSQTTGKLNMSFWDFKLGFRSFDDPGLDYSFSYIGLRMADFSYSSNNYISANGLGGGYLRWDSYDLDNQYVKLLSRFNFGVGAYYPGIERKNQNYLIKNDEKISSGVYVATQLGVGCVSEKYGAYFLTSVYIESNFINIKSLTQNLQEQDLNAKEMETQLVHVLSGIEFKVGYFFDSGIFFGGDKNEKNIQNKK